MRFLIVDDNADERKMLRYVLERHGHDVFEAEDGKQGLEKAALIKPDLIVSDALMPNMDGFEFLKKIKEDDALKPIPFVFYSSFFRGEKEREFAISLGAAEYIVRPIDSRELWNELRPIIEKNISGRAGESVTTGRAIEDKKFIEGYIRIIKSKLEETIRDLEKKIKERTAELEETNNRLNSEIAERKANENTLNAVLETLPVGVWITDGNGLITHGNASGQKIWAGARYVGIEQYGEYKGWWVASGKKIEAEEWALARAVMKGETSINEEIEIECFDGTHKIILNSAVPLLNEKNEVTGAIVVNQDITELKRAETEVEKMRKLESIGVLAGGIAHDFNNLMTAIIGNISLSKMYISPGDRAFDRLSDAEKACDQARELANRLITFSKGGEPFMKTVRIAGMVRETVDLLLGSSSNILYDVEAAHDLYPASIDEGQIRQALSNLITNAMEAMPEGGRLSIKAENETVTEKSSLPLKQGEYIRISMADTGEGISEEILPKIFDPYFTTKEFGSKKGMGLGLSIAYSIIKRHNGHISVDSRKGKGSVFSIYLPASAPMKDIQEAKGSSHGKDIRKRILVMEDTVFVKDVIGQMLDYFGYDAEFTGNGSEAISAYSEALKGGKPFDAVILDLIIPGGMGGDMVIKKLLDIDPKARGIVTSGYTNDPIMTEFRAYGFAAAIPKPYKAEQLRQTLEDVLQGKD